MSTQVYADYIDLYSEKTDQYNTWLKDSTNIHWSQYVDSNQGLGPAWLAESASTGIYPGMSKWDWGAQHYQKHGKNESRITPKVVNTNGMTNQSGPGGRQDYTTIAVSTNYGAPQSDSNVKAQFGYDKWERTQYDGSGNAIPPDKAYSRILPGTKFYVDSSGQLQVADTVGGIQTIGDQAKTTYSDLAKKINNAKPEEYKALMESIDDTLDEEQFSDLTNTANYTGYTYAGGLSLLSDVLKTKIPFWDISKYGAQPPVGAFDSTYYTTQTESGKTAQKEWDSYLNSVKVGDFVFNDETYTTQYRSSEGYAHWHYTSQGLPNGERGNKAEDAKAVTEYQEYLTDAERQVYRDTVLGISKPFNNIEEWSAAQDPEVLEEWYNSLPADQQLAYDEGTLPVPTLDYIPDYLRDDIVMTPQLTLLEGELSTVITAKDIQQQAMFGSLTQDSLKKSVDELNRVSRSQDEFDFYMGLEGFEEIASVNETLTNSLLGDSGIGGILAWMGSPDEYESSLEQQISDITGVPSRNSTIYSWQNWFEQNLLPSYDDDGFVIADAFDPNITYEVSAEFAKDYIDRYLRPRFDESKSMSEFISYMDVKQEEQNILQTQSALNKLKDLADLRAQSYLDEIYYTTNPAAGGTALVFDPVFYWDPTGNFAEDDPKYARYLIQKETVANDWEIAKEEGDTAKPEGEEYTWNQLAYLYGLDINDKDQFAKLHYQVKGFKEEYNFDPAKDVITLLDAEDYIQDVIIPEVEAEKLELGDITFLNFVTPAEFADAMLEGISPEENQEEWEKLLDSIGLSESELGIEEVREYIIEALSTGEALEIREAIKYLNEKKIKPTQAELGVNYIEREEDYQPTDSPTDTQLFLIFQDAGYQGTEEDFYRDFMPDVSMSEMHLLTQGQSGLETSNVFTGLSSSDPFEALASLQTLFEDEALFEPVEEEEQKPSYFTLFEEEDEFQPTEDEFFSDFSSLFRGL